MSEIAHITSCESRCVDCRVAMLIADCWWHQTNKNIIWMSNICVANICFYKFSLRLNFGCEFHVCKYFFFFSSAHFIETNWKLSMGECLDFTCGILAHTAMTKITKSGQKWLKYLKRDNNNKCGASIIIATAWMDVSKTCTYIYTADTFEQRSNEINKWKTKTWWPHTGWSENEML